MQHSPSSLSAGRRNRKTLSSCDYFIPTMFNIIKTTLKNILQYVEQSICHSFTWMSSWLCDHFIGFLFPYVFYKTAKNIFLKTPLQMSAPQMNSITETWCQLQTVWFLFVVNIGFFLNWECLFEFVSNSVNTTVELKSEASSSLPCRLILLNRLFFFKSSWL